MDGHGLNYEQELARSTPLVLREADALYEGRGRLAQTLERLAGRLDAMGIRYCLVGAYALILHGIRRFTEDIDVLLGPQDLETLRGELLGKGYRAVPGTQRCIRDTETGVRIDFVVSGGYPGDGRPKPVVFPEPDDCLAPDKEVRVVNLRTLVELKLASGISAPDRLQDLADVQRLIALHALKADFAEKLNPYVREKFLELHGTVAEDG